MYRMLMAAVVIVPSLLAQGGANCKPVGGGIITNFLNESSDQYTNATLGTATGDLKGGLGVNVLAVTPEADGSLVFHNRHHWVTDSGETILFADADATAYPIPAAPGLYAINYGAGTQIIGGTGRFAGASGTLAVFGAVNLRLGQIVLRYAGKVCFAPVAP
jgi:hypothetical protein